MELAKVFYSVYFGHANKIIIGSTGLGGRRRGGVFFFFFWGNKSNMWEVPCSYNNECFNINSHFNHVARKAMYYISTLHVTAKPLSLRPFRLVPSLRLFSDVKRNLKIKNLLCKHLFCFGGKSKAFSTSCLSSTILCASQTQRLE